MPHHTHETLFTRPEDDRQVTHKEPCPNLHDVPDQDVEEGGVHHSGIQRKTQRLRDTHDTLDADTGARGSQTTDKSRSPHPRRPSHEGRTGGTGTLRRQKVSKTPGSSIRRYAWTAVATTLFSYGIKPSQGSNNMTNSRYVNIHSNTHDNMTMCTQNLHDYITHSTHRRYGTHDITHNDVAHVCVRHSGDEIRSPLNHQRMCVTHAHSPTTPRAMADGDSQYVVVAKELDRLYAER